MRKLLPFSLVSKVLAAFLIMAAALKLQGLAVQPIASMGLLASPMFQFGLVELEVLLSLWLLSGRSSAAAWTTAFAAFTIFAGFSFYQGLIGRASCGCFGVVAVSPWYAFSLDLLVLGLLATSRPEWSSVSKSTFASWTAVVAPLGAVLVSLVVLCGLLTGVANYTFGSPEAALAWIRGERVSIQPRIVNLGTGAPGESRHTLVVLENWTDTPIRIIGGTSDCSCEVNDDLPVFIPPNGRRSVNVTFRSPDSTGLFSRKAFFLTDDNSARVLHFRLTGQVASTSLAQ